MVCAVTSNKSCSKPTQTVSEPCLTRNSRNALDGFWNLKTLLIGSNSQRKGNNMKVYMAGKITCDSTYREKFQRDGAM